MVDLASRHHSLVTMLTETWLSDQVLSSEVTVDIPGYNLYRCDRVGRLRGGVAMLVREDLGGEMLGSFDNGVVQMAVVRVHALKTVLCVMYRPPDTTLAELSPALTELDRILSDLTAPTPTLVLCGDFNFPKAALEWQLVDGVIVPVVLGHHAEGEGQHVRLQAERLVQLAYRHHMAQYVDRVTHGHEVLDLFFSNNPELVHSVSTESFPTFTDHMAVTVGVNYTLGKPPPKQKMSLLDSARRLKVLDFSKAP